MSTNSIIADMLAHIVTYIDKTNAKIDELDRYVKNQTVGNASQSIIEAQNAKIELLKQRIDTLEGQYKAIHSDVCDLIVKNDEQHNKFSSNVDNTNTILKGNGLTLNDNGKIPVPHMFNQQTNDYKHSITFIDTRMWDMSGKRSLARTFYNFTRLTTIDISTWDTSKTTVFSYMFCDCESLQRIIGIEDIDTSSAISIDSMFDGCKSLTYLDLSKWNVSNVINIDNIFHNCISLEHLDLSNWTTSQVVKNGVLQSNLKKDCDIPVLSGCSIKMFHNCHKLKDVVLSKHLKECVRLGYIEIPAYVTVK